MTETETRFSRLGTVWIEFSDALSPHSPREAGQGLALQDLECLDVPDQAHPRSIIPQNPMSLGYSELSDADAAACCTGGASFKDACLIKCLQGLGLPVSCPNHVVHSQFHLATPCFNHFCFHFMSGCDFQLHLMDSMERMILPASASLQFFASKVVEGILTKFDGDMMEELTLSLGEVLQNPAFGFSQIQQQTGVLFH